MSFGIGVWMGLTESVLGDCKLALAPSLSTSPPDISGTATPATASSATAAPGRIHFRLKLPMDAFDRLTGRVDVFAADPSWIVMETGLLPPVPSRLAPETSAR